MNISIANTHGTTLLGNISAIFFSECIKKKNGTPKKKKVFLSDFL